MKRVIKYFFVFAFIASSMFSCKDENSIQTYYVDHQELPNFRTYDVAAKLSEISDTEFTDVQKDILNSLHKLNILRYDAKNGTPEEYKKELEDAKKVFKNKAYNELMELSDNGIKFRINTVGDSDAVDEIMMLASSPEIGFAMVRILGEDMNPEKMIELIMKMQGSNVDKGQVNDIMNFLK